MKKIILTIFAALTSLLAMADTAPQYPGGKVAMDAFIVENLKYPAAASRNGIEGIVPLSFTVNADGSIGSIKVVRMIDPDLEQEAIRLVKSMPAWEPATKGGSPVAGTAELQITFTLPDGN